MIEQFINRYSLSKTLRFSLLPVGKTEENFDKKLLLEQDEKLAAEYEKVKKYIDRYHKSFIDTSLSQFAELSCSHADDTDFCAKINTYAALYYQKNKDKSAQAKQDAMEANLRKIIAKKMESSDGYNNLFSKALIQEVLPGFLTEAEEKQSVELFKNFTSYFSGFHENRRNMYSEEDQTTAISHRCINDNLPKFLDNCASFLRIKETLPKETLEQLNSDALNLSGFSLYDFFSIDFFPRVLPQFGIERYNDIIGGYSCSDGTKVKGLNEFINLYNQLVSGNGKANRLPFMKPLYKQILSDRGSISFIPEKFTSDNELLSAVKEFYCSTLCAAAEGLRALFTSFESYNMAGIFVSSGPAISDLSNAVFGSWNAVSSAWYSNYESAKPLKPGKDAEKYQEEERAAYKRNKSFSISELQALGNSVSEASIPSYYTVSVPDSIARLTDSYEKAEDLLSFEYSDSRKLCTNTAAIELIKNFLDSVKALEYLVKPLLGTGKEADKDEVFYGEFLPLYSSLASVDKLYDKVRNYLTQKPYSKDKIKLNFGNPQFLEGWPYTMEDARSSFILKDKDKYYLAVMDPDHRTAFRSFDAPASEDDTLQKMYYYQIADPAKDLPNLMVIDGKTVKKNGRKSSIDGENHILEGLRNKYLPENINRIRKEKSFSVSSENFSKSDLSAYIAYYQERVSEYYSNCHFNFYEPEQYASFPEFTAHVNSQAYQVWFENISKTQVMTWVDNGQLYLFQIYNKDFSEHSKGTPNLHTLYFRMLFDERNLRNVVYQLNGGAEMFYRKASISEQEKIVHPAHQAIANKNPANEKKKSIFEYDLIKDRRFTKRQFSLHLPITLNFQASGNEVANLDVRKALKQAEDQYVIGIDRGERNLLYVCVINGKGKIVEQLSLNEIISDNGHRVDYHELLSRKEQDRDIARKSWKTIENIKELKEGYMSQAVHKICELVLRYDAVIAMEDLNSGFMNSRVKVEKSVYRKFEKMLTDKLTYLADKNANPESDGGLLKAYQLTNKPNGKQRGIQDGIVFYIPAWNTSKIDPTTGFVDLLKPKYTNVESAKDFFSRFNAIKYNKAEDMFEFCFNYSNFPKGSTAGKTEWTVCTNGSRIKTFRNPEKNSEWDNKTVILTDAFKALFENYSINCSSDLKDAILSQNTAAFFKELISLLALTLQMRNSITGRTDVDYIISPVKNTHGVFYDSRTADSSLPSDADANGAYNIARKVQWAISVLKDTDENNLKNAKLSITNKDWIAYAINQT